MKLTINSKISIAYIFCILCGIIFLLSGFGKMLDTGQFTRLISSYGFEPFRFLAPVIIIAEILLGLGFILQVRVKEISLISLFLVVIFTFIYLYGQYVKEISDCGCFGKIEKLSTSPLVTYIRNILLTAMLLYIYKYAPAPSDKYISLRCWIIFIVITVSSFWSGYTMNNNVKKGNNKIHPLINKTIRETILPELNPFSPDSVYLVYIFSYNCENCWNHVENLKCYNDSPLFDKVIAFAAGEDRNNEFYEYFKPDFTIIEAEESKLAELTRVSPTLLYIQNDTIRYVIQGSVPSVYIFEKNYISE